MNEDLAKQVIREAIDLAIKKGCYDLVAVSNIISAINVLNIKNNKK
jgi:hypothetical protein